MIMNKAKVIVKMIVVRHYLLVSFVICFVILLLFGDDFGDKDIFYHFFSFQGFSCFFSGLLHRSHAGSRGVPVHLSGEHFL